MRMSITKRRTAASIPESATKELQSLAEFMLNLADTDARTLALLLYYIYRIDRWRISHSCWNKVSQMFLVSAAAVKKWSAPWEATGKDALFDNKIMHEEYKL